jgi:hypothetical protein
MTFTSSIKHVLSRGAVAAAGTPDIDDCFSVEGALADRQPTKMLSYSTEAASTEDTTSGGLDYSSREVAGQGYPALDGDEVTGVCHTFSEDCDETAGKPVKDERWFSDICAGTRVGTSAATGTGSCTAARSVLVPTRGSD